MQTFDRELDTRGLNCPMPILKAKKSIAELDDGQVLRVAATDPGAVKDFEAFCRQSGHELLESTAADNEFVFLIRKH
ncbi:MAG: sulfurtransferase TusA family protein [Gammaproteobacteria bacterium]